MIERCPLRLVLGADTVSPTAVGALLVAVHPDDGCLSSTCLLVTFRSACFLHHSVWHFLALKEKESKEKTQKKGPLTRHSQPLRDSEKAFSASKGLWRPIPASAAKGQLQGSSQPLKDCVISLSIGYGRSYVQILSWPLDPIIKTHLRIQDI